MCDVDPMMIGAMCVAGTSMGEKMEAAITDCYNIPEDMATGRAGKKGKGKGKGGKGGKSGKGGKGSKGDKCPTFDEIVQKIDSETAG